MGIATSISIIILFIMRRSYFAQENICPSTSGEKVVHACEGNFATGASVYLDTAKAVNYQGNCACQLRAHGGAVDLQLTVHGVHTDCDATLYFPPPIDYNYRCSDKTSSNSTGRIELGQVLFLTLIKGSEVADFCVHLVQTSTQGGSLNLACSEGTLQSSSPLTTTSSQPNATSNVVTLDTSVTEAKDLTGNNSTTTATESKDPSGDNSTTTATERKDQSGDNSTTTATESKDSSGDNSTTTATDSKDPSGDNSTTTATERKEPSGDNSTTTATESKDPSGDNSTTTATESKDPSGDNSTTTATESKDPSGDNSTTTATEGNSVTGNNSSTTASSGETPDITPAERIGPNNAASSQSKVTVSFVVVGLVAAIVSK